MKNKKLIITFIIFVILYLVGFTYVNDYYRATPKALNATLSTSTVTVHEIENHTLVFEPQEIKDGFIFYPGGKVDYTAYAPLLHSLAENGTLCFLVQMPFNLAVLDMNAADGIQSLYPEVKDWYIGGHSLGGSMAASYASKHLDDYKGLVLLAAYSTVDLSHSNLDVLSIYGSNDKVLNLEKYEAYKTNLPENFSEYVIPGGCHAYFGSYGLQKGDGLATLTNDEQIEITAYLIENELE